VEFYDDFRPLSRYHVRDSKLVPTEYSSEILPLEPAGRLYAFTSA
jgi:hypothetical protein